MPFLINLPAPSTLAILGTPLSAKHDSYRNKRALQDAVRAGKEREAPAGLQWNGTFQNFYDFQFRNSTTAGLVQQYEKDLKNLKPEEQYIWHLRMEGSIKLIVTANPVLAALIHDAQYLVCDYTFKRTNGELNEWEVAIWRGASNERKWNRDQIRLGMADNEQVLLSRVYTAIPRPRNHLNTFGRDFSRRSKHLLEEG